MEHRVLGRSGIKVSRLCFGSLTLGPLQCNLPLDTGAQVLAHAIELGVNFTDTAQLYQTYSYIRQAMRITGKYDLVVSSKTYAYTRELAVQAVEEARREIGRDYIDIFMLHEQESIHTLRGHMEAAEYLLECKAKGIIRAVGVSAHHIAAVRGTVELGIFDVIHPIFNYMGIGIADGTIGQMEDAAVRAYDAGIGIFAMKALGGGNLYRSSAQALKFVMDKPYVDSIAVGMQSISEVEANIAFFENGSFPDESREYLSKRQRSLHIEQWCERCGRCVDICPQQALKLPENGIVELQRDKCICCGYCGAACPVMGLKML